MIGRKNKATSIIAIAVSLTVFVQVEAFLSTPAGPRIQSLPFSLRNGKFKNQKVCKNTIGPRLHVSYVPWESPNSGDGEELGPLAAAITKFGMIAYITCMCIALPMALFPTAMLYQSKLIDKTKCERLSLQTGESCAYGLLQAIPFLNLKVIGHHEGNPEPSIWVCNHTSMLDVFILLASDEKLRGKNKRPIKAVYVRKCWLLDYTTRSRYPTDILSPHLFFRVYQFLQVARTRRKSGDKIVVSHVWFHSSPDGSQRIRGSKRVRSRFLQIHAQAHQRSL